MVGTKNQKNVNRSNRQYCVYYRQGLGVHWQGTLQCTLLVISKGVPPIFWAVPAGGTLFFGPKVYPIADFKKCTSNILDSPCWRYTLSWPICGPKECTSSSKRLWQCLWYTEKWTPQKLEHCIISAILELNLA